MEIFETGVLFILSKLFLLVFLFMNYFNYVFYRCNVLHSGENYINFDYFMSIGKADYKLKNSQIEKNFTQVHN